MTRLANNTTSFLLSEASTQTPGGSNATSRSASAPPTGKTATASAGDAAPSSQERNSTITKSSSLSTPQASRTVTHSSTASSLPEHTPAGHGTLSCKGGYRVEVGALAHTYNNSLICNGNLTSNGTINCAGVFEEPKGLLSSFGRDILSVSNGTLSCNGTLHNNGTIRGNVRTSCNGTISISTLGKDAPGANVTLSCNGTLGGNGTFDARAFRKRQAAGTCATHLIKNGDTCFAIAQQYGVTVDNIEGWNKGKTWGWQGCADLLVGYIMCIGSGGAPMPAPQ